ncbi:hypothetical protein AVEN_257191-1 [Araneus ventricosus]|uniref:Uncharacterized protein n=1 Tax=Araneus ventricosus TaxID=182803 RepID=A0A4Y2F270_ARAVE|nr:hypothetical protein AVEN_257191-1 [Araneus ventricosus]
MKKASVCKGNKKTQAIKQFNMKLSQGDDKNKPHCVSDSDCMVESQAEYIENLQQQIFVLENEVAYLYPFISCMRLNWILSLFLKPEVPNLW